MEKLPRLRRIHSDEILEKGAARFSLEFWRRKNTKDIIESLAARKIASLKVKTDGRIFDGNVRCKVLEERGFDINQLERETID
jgi:hypothetical protein